MAIRWVAALSLLLTVVTADSTFYPNLTVTSSTTALVGDFIAQGLGATTGNRTVTSATFSTSSTILSNSPSTSTSSSSVVTTSSSSSTPTPSSSSATATISSVSSPSISSTLTQLANIGTTDTANSTSIEDAARVGDTSTLTASGEALSSPSQTLQNTTTQASVIASSSSSATPTLVCSPDYDGWFGLNVSVVAAPVSSRFVKRAALLFTLNEGVLTSNGGLTAYFDATGALNIDNSIPNDARHTNDWCVMTPNVLAVGNQTVFFRSGANILDRSLTASDIAIKLEAVPQAALSTASTISSASAPTASVVSNSTASANGTGTAVPESTATSPSNSTTFPNSTSGPLSQCFNDIQSWSSASSSWFTATGSAQVSTSVSLKIYSSDSTVAYPTSAYTTLCDGFPRVSGKPIISVVTSTQSYTITSAPNYTMPRPTCGLDSIQCSEFWTSYSSCSNSSAYFIGAGLPVTTGPCAAVLGSTLCQNPFPVTKSSNSSGFCAIAADGVRLHYWPVTTVSGDLCNRTGITIKPTGPAPTAVVRGITITSPMIAVEIDSLSLLAEGLTEYQNVTQSKFDVMITLPEDQLYSGQPANHIVLNSFSFNYNDLNPGQVPWSAWTRQGEYVQRCGGYSLTRTDINPLCNHVFVDNYSPVLAAMTQVAELAPGWEDCYPLFGLWDPPTALTPVQSVIAPSAAPAAPSSTTTIAPKTSTQAPVVVTTTAVPAQAPTSAVNTPTAAPVQATSSAAAVVPASTATNADRPGQPIASSEQAQSSQQPQADSSTNVAPTSAAAQSTQLAADPQPQSSATLVAGSTLEPGSSAVVVGSTTFTALPGTSGIAVIAGGTTSTIVPVAASSAAPAVGVTPSVIAANPAPASSATVIAGQTLVPGSSAVVVGSTTFSALPSGSGVAVVANGQTSTVVPSTAGSGSEPSVVAVGSGGAAASSATVIAGQTLVAGSSAVVVGSTTFSALPSGSGVAVVADGQTSTIVPSSAASGAAAIAAGPSVVAVSSQSAGASSATILAGQTLAAGSSAVIVGSTTFTALPSGSGVAVIANGQTSTIAASAIATATGSNNALPSVVAAGSSGSGSSSVTVINGQTLAAGSSAVVVGSTTFTALPGSSGVEIIANGKTSTISPSTAGSAAGILPSVVAVGPSGPAVSTVALPQGSAESGPVTLADGQVITVAPAAASSTVITVAGANGPLTLTLNPSAVAISGQTLSAGQSIIIGGKVFSINSAGQVVDVHSDTIATGSVPGVMVVDGTTLQAAHAAQTINGEVFSVDPKGNLLLIAGSKTLTVSPQGSAIVVDGTTISQGSEPVTVGGEVFSVNAQGQLIAVSTSTIAHLPSASAIVIDGTTLAAGGEAKTINGDVFSVTPDGHLVQVLGDGDPIAGLAGMIASIVGGSGAMKDGLSTIQATSTEVDSALLTSAVAGLGSGSSTVQGASAPTSTHSGADAIAWHSKWWCIFAAAAIALYL
ncbi:hypothetical protein B0A48_14189 [Cryoendolithus antarcticus]|uniref:VWFD domain-containing protein n=1 Tax=Cryoendolithus antarcticus TaxID=1507870 RepID=A0A1V8SLE5_9PEZI|nr:hypothetical protein B0A48_14189 [Cryoendolithus antarcticus]